MGWKQNPYTGESYQEPDPAPGAGTESGYQDPTAGNKNPPPAWSGPLPAHAGGAAGPNNPNGTKQPPPAAPTPPPQPPVSFNGMSFNPTTAPFGFDMSSPGVMEQYWNNNQNLWMNTPQLDWINSILPQFNSPWFGESWNQQNMGGIGAPGAGQQFWNGIQGQFNQMTPAQQQVQQGYKGNNNALTAFNSTKAMAPGSFQQGFDKYYDRMKDKVMSDVNAQSAARGSYGSNTALNNTIGAGLDVEAQRAKAQTDFDFQNSQNQLAWQNAIANQGRAADLSGLGAFRANLGAADQSLDRIKTFGDLAFRAEGMDLEKDKTMSDIAFGIDDKTRERLDSGISTAFGLDQGYGSHLDRGFNAAGAVQSAREQRIGGLYDDVGGFSNDVMSFFSENYDKLLGGDQALSDAELEAMIAQAADQRGWDQQTQERIFRDAKAAYDMIMGDKANKAATGAG